MDCATFREHVLAYIDGEMADELRSAALEHEHACTGCAGAARAERAFEDRTRTALLADVPDGAFDRLLATAKARVEHPVRGAVVPFRRVARAIASLAALLLVAVTAMWSLCIPPFECAYLQAVEAAATIAPAAPFPAPGARSGVYARLEAPEQLLTFDRTGEAEAVQVSYRGGARAVRAEYEAGGERFTIIWSDLIGSSPSFRRRVERNGLEWWIADENGRTVVTFLCPETHTLCALVGALSEDRLCEIATEIRCR